MLIERDKTLKALTNLRSRAAEGNGAIALVYGEAGIGKTSVLSTFRDREAEASEIFWGGCDPLFTPRPLGPIHDMACRFDGHVRRLLNEGADSPALFAAIVDNLQRTPGPKILVIEDAHWADNATLDLLKFLGRRISLLPALLTLSYRDDEIDQAHPLKEVLGEFPPAYTHALGLAPLSPGGVEKLCKISNVSYDQAQLYEITGGNPFFVDEVLNSAASAGETLSPSVKEAMETRLFQLSEEECGFLETLSVLPGMIPNQILTPLFGDKGDLFAMAALGRKLLVRADSGGLRFRHELARLAITARLTPNQERRVHARLLEAMMTAEAFEPTYDQLVHHAAGALDAHHVLEFAPRAAEIAAAFGAHRESASHLSTALRFVDEAEPELAAGLYEKWAYEAGLALKIDDDVIDARRHAITLWRALGRKEKVAENLRWLSRLHWYRAESAEASRYADEAVRILENSPPSAERAMAYSLRSQLHMLSDDMEEAISWGNRALEMAAEYDEPEIRIHALNNVGTAKAFRDDATGIDMLRESLELARAHGFHEHAARVYTNLSEYGVEFKDFDLAEQIISEGIAFDTRHDLDSWTHYLVGRQAQLRLEQGRLKDAELIADGVMKLDRLTLLMKLPALLVLSKTRTLLGADDAGRLLARSLEHANATEEPQHIIPAHLYQLLHAWLQDDRRLAEHSLKSLSSIPAEAMHKWHRGDIAIWHHRMGAPVPKAFARDLAPPHLREMEGDMQGSGELWRALGAPICAALALAQGGADDVEALAAAAAIAKETGAEALSRKVRGRAEALGVGDALPKAKRGPYNAARNHPLGLTQKEQTILALIVQGQSNPQIADKLSRSKRTVEHHVSSILRKMNVESRMDAMLRVRNEPWLI